MVHKMHLYQEPFELIKSGKKTIEIRLNDQKRQKVKIGDQIIFTRLPDNGEKIRVEVRGLLKYGSFRELYTDIPADLFGLSDKSLEWMLESTYQIYDREREKKYGVLGIKINLL